MVVVRLIYPTDTWLDFLWLDKLGYSAKAGVKVVIRQTLFGGYYSLIGHDLQPNPDYWVSVLFKKFVSSRVLNLNSFIRSTTLRLYAHCASKQALEDSKIVMYGININGQKKIHLRDLPKKQKFFLTFLLQTICYLKISF